MIGAFTVSGVVRAAIVIEFVRRREHLDFNVAVAKLASALAVGIPAAGHQPRAPTPLVESSAPIWNPILPVPSDAPALMQRNGRTVELINPKHTGTPKERASYRPVMGWTYRDADRQLLGYVLRMAAPPWLSPGGGKWFVPITYCIGPGGAHRWCVVPFPAPRPLYGLAELAARPAAPVIVTVEGEKACRAARRLLPEYVAVAWPGGCKSIAHIDWSPLGGRDVLLALDNDQWARQAADGWVDRGGKHHPGIAERLAPPWLSPGAQRVRVVDPPADLEEGWDLADAAAAGWSHAQAAQWLTEHLRPARLGRARTSWIC